MLPSVQRLQHLLQEIPPLLQQVREGEFSFKPSPQKWSKKEILGHLVDSAANNHQRFIRVQYEERPSLRYNQDQWNSLSHYNEKNTPELIQFWVLYNQHLLHILRNLRADSLKKECDAGGTHPVTLEWLIDDYVQHLEHHLHQLVTYR